MVVSFIALIHFVTFKVILPSLDENNLLKNHASLQTTIKTDIGAYAKFRDKYVGRGGSLVESIAVDRRVVGSHSALAAT